MGVYFTDVTMPKSCVECKTNMVHIECKKWETIVQDISSRRADDCPLREVKCPHGDLIDRNEVELLLSIGALTTYLASTIIEAEDEPQTERSE